MKFIIAFLLVALTGVSAFGQAPTLRIETPDGPGLPAQLFYGNVKVKPVRIRPGTNQIITIDDKDFYVQQHYVDFLSRFPDQAGFNFWFGQMTNCSNPPPADLLVCSINVSASFFLSIEFQNTGYLVERLYRVAYGEATKFSTLGGTSHNIQVPIVRFEELMPDGRQIANGVVVGQTGWEAVLENNKQNFITSFVQRARFLTDFPTSMSPTAFVDKLNTNAGNVLSASERTAAINLFGGAGDTSNVTARRNAVRQVAEDSDLDAAEKNKAFVLMQFMGYLRRDPDEGQDTPIGYAGYEFWLNKLNQFNGNYIEAELVKAFITSVEYRERF